MTSMANRKSALATVAILTSIVAGQSQCCYSFGAENPLPGRYNIDMTAAVEDYTNQSGLSARVFFPQSYRIMETERPDGFEGSSSCRPLEDDGTVISGANLQLGNAVECTTLSRDEPGLWRLNFELLVTDVIDQAAPEQVFLNGVECAYTAGVCEVGKEDTAGLVLIGENYVHLAVLIVPPAIALIALIIFAVWAYRRSHVDPEDPEVVAKRHAKKQRRHREGGVLNGILGHYFLGKRPEKKAKEAKSKGPSTRSLTRNASIGHAAIGKDEELGSVQYSPPMKHGKPIKRESKPMSEDERPRQSAQTQRTSMYAPSRAYRVPSTSDSTSENSLPAPAYEQGMMQQSNSQPIGNQVKRHRDRNSRYLNVGPSQSRPISVPSRASHYQHHSMMESASPNGSQYSNVQNLGIQQYPQMFGQPHQQRRPLSAGPTLVEQLDAKKMDMKRAVIDAQARSAQPSRIQRQHQKPRDPQSRS